MKRTWLFFICILMFATQESSAQCSISRPTVSVTSITSCAATISWNAVSGAAYYKVRYKVNGTSAWTTMPDKLSTTSYTFTGLAAGIKYKVSVGAFCSNDKTSGYKNITVTTEKISAPQGLIASALTGNSITISWVPVCNVTTFNLVYKESSQTTWIAVNNISTTAYTVTGLNAQTNYDFSVQSQNGTLASAWTSTLTVNSGSVSLPTGTKPNILIYMLDDARYDPFQPNGGPDWFNTPAINRIANEGINFRYTFPTTSQCAPSRVSFYSGLYASKHGAFDNSSKHFTGIPLISQILKDAGYYTGFIGKYGQFQGNPEGFSWWATSTGDVYEDASYKINGIDTVISGHISDVYSDLANTFLQSVPPGQKFLLFFNTRIPHTPTVPREEDLNLYIDETMPFPGNFSQYSNNYPSYFYSPTAGHSWTKDDVNTREAKLEEFQCLHGAELNVQELLDTLTNRGILDSTLFIFTSDNGYLEGEHLLAAKQIAQEESIRIPLFIRYPTWFTAGTVNTSLMINNIDIPVTLLDAAGIPDTFGMDGTSILKLLTNEVQRKYFYYQFTGDGSTPSIRAVRSLQYKYVKHYCNQLTEEFYDLANDPSENVNEINNSSYTALITTYRNALDSLITAMGETAPSNISCTLNNPQFQRESEEYEEAHPTELAAYPNPAQGYFIVDFRDEEREEIQCWITDLLERPVYYKSLPNTNSFNIAVECGKWDQGMYTVRIKKGSKFFSTRMVIQ